MIYKPDLNKLKEELIPSNMFDLVEIISVMNAKNAEEIYDLVCKKLQSEIGTAVLKEKREPVETERPIELRVYLNPKCENKLGQFCFTFKNSINIVERQKVTILVDSKTTVKEIKDMFANPEEIWSLEINL